MQPICVTLQPGPGDNLTAALSTRKPEASSGCTPSLVGTTLARPCTTRMQPCGPECQTPSSQSLCKPPVACVLWRPVYPLPPPEPVSHCTPSHRVQIICSLYALQGMAYCLPSNSRPNQWTSLLPGGQTYLLQRGLSPFQVCPSWHTLSALEYHIQL